MNRKQIRAMWGGIVGILVVWSCPIDPDGKVGERPYIHFLDFNVYDAAIRNFELAFVLLITAGLIVTFGQKSVER